MAKQKRAHDQITLLAPGTVTAAGTVSTTAVRPHIDASAYMFVLDVTDCAAAVGDTLTVYVQSSWSLSGTPATTRWINICRFTTLLGNGVNTLCYANKVCAYAPVGTEIEVESATPTPNTLLAGEVYHYIGDELRVQHTVVDGGAHGQSFTFSAVAIPM